MAERQSHFGEQRGADLLLLLLLLLWPCTESETPWTGRSETCPTPGQFAGAHLRCFQNHHPE